MKTKNAIKQVYDRTDLQLAVCEQLVTMPIEDLVAYYNKLTGAELEVVDKADESVCGDSLTISEAEAEDFRTWLSFLNSVLPERVTRWGDQEGESCSSNI